MTRNIQILLTHRSDKYWHGWHIPGGLWRTQQTLEECIASIAKNEVSHDCRISLLAKGMWEKWHDHPYGWPVSHVAICIADSVHQNESIRWFENVPGGMIEDGGHHARFIQSALNQAEKLI
jgi:ADP-ribose pyrophosphatase YjhB (NUDIX family)